MEKVKEIPYEIVLQILTYLPTKALDRFKCVSTSWSSMIFQHRPYGRMLLNVSSDDITLPSNSKKCGLFCATIRVPLWLENKVQDLNTETFVHQVSLPFLDYENITPVVNGLACLYMDHKVSLFNISTCEIMNLPSSSLNLESARRIWYTLGFDPIDNVYKLLKLCRIQKPDEPYPYRYRNHYDDYGNVCDNEYELVCEILTLETSLTWREIGVSNYLYKFSCVRGQSYYVNGVIFWKFCKESSNDNIVAFDVHKENFTTIEPPRFAPTRRFGQYGGNLALSYTHTPSYDPWILDIWVLENHQKDLWTEVTINLPNEVQKYFDEATPIGNFPSGELLLLCFERQKMEGTFFTYDAIKKKFTKLMVELPRSLGLARRTGYPAHMSCLFDNIMSNNAALNDLF